MSIALPPVLVVDDEKNMRLSLETVLGDEGYGVTSVESAEEGLSLLERERFLMVISDAHLGGMTGYEFLARIRRNRAELPVLMITAYATPKLAVEAIKAGAIDYLSKPFEPEELVHAVARCAERYRLLQENAALRLRAAEVHDISQIIGESPKMQELRELIQTVARSNATVLILGESGTGKELIAGALHGLSARQPAHYIRINCAAIPETLLESELFGHEKGAFTGAISKKDGKLAVANRGTVFLDEIGEMTLSMQSRLLRFLQDHKIERVGSTTSIKLDVRVLAATNRNLEEAIKLGSFRADLYHRLDVVKVTMPPLRDRREDIPLLSSYFAEKYAKECKRPISGISPEARTTLQNYNWPGNVRELENAIERAVVLGASETIGLEDLPRRLLDAVDDKEATSAGYHEAVKDAKRQLIMKALENAQGNYTEAAKALGIHPNNLHRIIRTLDLKAAVAR